MPRGRTVKVDDEELVKTDEIQNEPNHLLPDGEYGIRGKYRDFSLVKSRLATRTGTEDDGENCGKRIQYTMFEDVPCYSKYLVDMFENYARVLNMTAFKKLKMNTSIEELVKIHKETQRIITDSLKGFDQALTDDQKEVCQLLDMKEKLKDEIAELQSDLSEFRKVKADIEKIHKRIKDEETIVIDRNKPKKHRTPKEED